jgi:cytochrome c oxidase cbb3-type subunit 3/ubiquinol-cytochrome c reductase cytochrome c subunit
MLHRVAAATLLSSLLIAFGCADVFRRPTTTIQRGSEIYARTCAVCHGSAGEGYKADRAPALATPAFLASASDEFLISAIGEGRAGTTMSAWSARRGGPLTPADMAALIAFMRTWERGPRAKLDERPASGDAARGAEHYEARCLSCHGDKKDAGPYNRLGAPDFLAAAGNGFLRRAIYEGREGTPMPGFAEALGDKGVEDVIALLRRWQAETPASPQPAAQGPIPLGTATINSKGPEPEGFKAFPAMVSVDAAKAQLDRGAKMAFLDARAPDDYAREHIAGAVSVPFYDPSPYLASLPKDAWLICYCACPHAESGQLARKLLAAGFKTATVLDEGLLVWKQRGYPTRAGRAP